MLGQQSFGKDGYHFIHGTGTHLETGTGFFFWFSQVFKKTFVYFVEYLVYVFIRISQLLDSHQKWILYNSIYFCQFRKLKYRYRSVLYYAQASWKEYRQCSARLWPLRTMTIDSNIFWKRKKWIYFFLTLKDRCLIFWNLKKVFNFLNTCV